MGDLTYILYQIPSGKLLHSYGKSTMLIGILIINGPFSIAMLVYQMVYPFIAVLGMVSNWFFHSQWLLMFQKCFFSISPLKRRSWNPIMTISHWSSFIIHYPIVFLWSPFISRDQGMYYIYVYHDQLYYPPSKYDPLGQWISYYNYTYIYHKL
jgi:hypothetical protein